MGFTTLDLSAAAFPVGFAIWDGTAITSENPGDSIEFVIPGLALDPTKYYEFQFDVDAYDESLTLPYLYFTATDAAETGTSYPELGETFDPTESGNPCTLTVYVGPGLQEWDTTVPIGYNHPWFYFDSDVRITAGRYRTMRLTALSDWRDDALPVWVSRQSFPADAREVVVSADGSPTPATVDDCWDGTGSIGVEVTDYSVFESSADVSSKFSSPSIFACLWQQSWLTLKRTGSDPTVSTGLLPEGSTAQFVEWEASSVPNDVRLNLLLLTTAYDQGYEWFMKIVPGLTPGGAAYHPGFVSGGDVSGLDTLVVVSPSALNSTVHVDADRLADFGIGPTGSVQFALAPVDQWTEDQSWAYDVPPTGPSMKVSTSLEAGYKLRYKARFLVPEGGVDPARQLWPRNDDAGPALGRVWPPPDNPQSGVGFGANAPL